MRKMQNFKMRKLLAAAALAWALPACAAVAAEAGPAAETLPPAETEAAAETELAKKTELKDETELTDGTYFVEVTLSGGSGKTTVESPAKLIVADGEITATITFSSSNYDYMLIGDQRCEPVNTEGNSTFEIPVDALDEELPVIADTTAMSEPHEIEYTLYFDSATLKEAEEEWTEAAGALEDTAGVQQVEEQESGQTQTAQTDENSYMAVSEVEDYSEDASEAAAQAAASGEDWCGLTWERSLALSYATQFAVDYYEGGYARIVIAGTDVYLLVPEEADVPDGLDADVVILQQPLQNLYLVATSAMDFFSALDTLDAIRLSGTDADGWYIEKAREAMEDGSILYAGKYSAPDYELILSEGCQLAIESTMIYHNPEVKEKLEGFGIPVLVERSSYESHPLGRSEWIKLYAVLLGCEEKAEEIFAEQAEKVQALADQEPLGETVAFFYITSAGTVNVHRPGDYLAKMIELAGGTYVFSDLGGDDSAASSVNLTMEEFYAQAKDADFLIYNSTIDGELYTISDLLAKSELLADFQAVQEGNVWCTGKNLFQETTSLGDVIVQIHEVLSGDGADEDLTCLHRLTDDR